MRATLFLAPLAVAAGVLATPIIKSPARPGDPALQGLPIYFWSRHVRDALREKMSAADAKELAFGAELIYGTECNLHGGAVYWYTTPNWSSSFGASVRCDRGNTDIAMQILRKLKGWEQNNPARK